MEDKIKKIFLIFLILIISAGTASAQWANSSLPYKIPIHINNTGNASNLIEFQTYYNLSWDSRMNANFSDILIYNDSSYLKQSLYIKNKTNGSYANLLINFSYIPASVWTNNTYFAYFNNSSMISESNATKTYDFYDNFDDGATTGWNVQSGTWSAASGYLTETGHVAAWQGISTPFAKDEFVFEADILWQGDTAIFDFFDKLGNTVATTGYGLSLSTGVTGYIYEYPASSIVKSFSKDADSNWHNYQIKRNVSGGVSVVYDNVDKGSGIDATPLTGSLYLSAWSFASGGVSSYFDNISVRKYAIIEPYAQSGNVIALYSNNYTNDQTLNFSVLKNTQIQFLYNNTTLDWYVNGVSQGATTNYFNYTFTGNNISTNITVEPNTGSNITWNVTSLIYSLQLLSPANGSTVLSPVTMIWREWPLDDPYTYQIATDSQFINIVTTGSGTTNGTEFITATQSLVPNIYYWRVKNTTSGYTNWFNYTIISPPLPPGGFNITVWDEVNTSKQILNYSVQLYNVTHVVIKNSNTTTGWTNFSTEISSGEYLITVIPNGTFSNYYQRMVLSTSSNTTNVSMYVPNSTNATINLISFSILDITGLFNYKTSTIAVYKGGLLQDKSYFSADGTHPVYLISGTNYQIQIQNGNSLFDYGTYIPIVSGSAQLTINDFTVNTSSINPFIYNITYNISAITLNWADVGNSLNNFNFTVRKGNPLISHCQLTTSINYGQSVCAIDNTTQYYVIFSANMTDGTFRNQSFVIDYSLQTGIRTNSTGTSAIDGSLIGTGYLWNYGTFTMPDWAYNWGSLILIIILAGSFGGYHSGLGGIITLFFALILELSKLFRPLGQDNTVVIGITIGLLFLSILYYLQHKERGG